MLLFFANYVLLMDLSKVKLTVSNITKINTVTLYVHGMIVPLAGLNGLNGMG